MKVFGFLVLCLTAFSGYAQDAAPFPEEAIGLTLEQAITTFGYPDSMYVYRGEEAWQDDVVFYYPNHLYLFWYNDRVWQLRLDNRYTAPFLGLSMGDTREKVTEVLGSPLGAEENWEVYQMVSDGFSIRARIFYSEDGVINDVYIYRGDY